MQNTHFQNEACLNLLGGFQIQCYHTCKKKKKKKKISFKGKLLKLAKKIPIFQNVQKNLRFLNYLIPGKQISLCNV